MTLRIIGPIDSQNHSFTYDGHGRITGIIDQAGNLSNVVTNFNTLADIPPGFVGTAAVGFDTFIGDGISFIPSSIKSGAVKFHGNLATLKEQYRTLANAIRATLNGTANTRILLNGDSTTLGSGELSTLQVPNSYVHRAAEIINKRIVKGGWQSNYGSIVGGPTFTFSTQDTRLLDYPAGWSTFDLGTVGNNTNKGRSIGGSLAYNNTTTNPITFTPSAVTDTLDVYYVDVGAGYNTFSVKVGGVQIGALAAPTGSASIKKLSVSTGVAAALNTYTIQREVTGTGAMIVGFEAYNSAEKEITFVNAGCGGTFIDTNLAQTTTATYYTALKMLTDATSTVKFNAVCINFGINHWLNSTAQTAVNFESSLNYAVSTLVTAGIPVVLFIPPKSGLTVGSPLVTDAIMQGYVDAIYRTATTYSLAVIDIYSKFGSNATAKTLGYMHTDNVHITNVGYSKIASYFADFINYLVTD